LKIAHDNHLISPIVFSTEDHEEEPLEVLDVSHSDFSLRDKETTNDPEEQSSSDASQESQNHG